MGLAQFMPATWAEWGMELPIFDPAASLSAGARYMQWIPLWLKSQGLAGTWDQVLASYNWGIGSVRNAVFEHGDNWLESAPEQTQEYVEKLAPHFSNGGSTSTTNAATGALLVGLGALLWMIDK
jgi:soluble lytic murein transglycosylase-like protein